MELQHRLITGAHVSLAMRALQRDVALVDAVGRQPIDGLGRQSMYPGLQLDALRFFAIVERSGNSLVDDVFHGDLSWAELSLVFTIRQFALDGSTQARKVDVDVLIQVVGRDWLRLDCGHRLLERHRLQSDALRTATPRPLVRAAQLRLVPLQLL